jgi:hypothetical protein
MSIRIRNDQIKPFDDQAEENFVKKVKSLVKEHRGYVTDNYTEAELDIMVANGIERARKHGIESELAIFRFVDVMFGVAPNFDEHSIPESFLAPGETHPDERVSTMINLMTAMDWEEVKKIYDPSAWGLSGINTTKEESDSNFGGRK